MFYRSAHGDRYFGYRVQTGDDSGSERDRPAMITGRLRAAASARRGRSPKLCAECHRIPFEAIRSSSGQTQNQISQPGNLRRIARRHDKRHLHPAPLACG